MVEVMVEVEVDVCNHHERVSRLSLTAEWGTKIYTRSSKSATRAGSSNNRPAAITQRVVTYSRVKPYQTVTDQTVTAMWQLNWYHFVWSTTGTGNWHEGAAKLNWYYHNFQKSLYRGIGSFVSCTMAHHVFPHPMSFSFSSLLPSMHEGFVDCFHCWGPSSSHRQWPGASNGGGVGFQGWPYWTFQRHQNW